MQCPRALASPRGIGVSEPTQRRQVAVLGGSGELPPLLPALVGTNAGLGRLTHCGSLLLAICQVRQHERSHTKPPATASQGGPVPQGRASPLPRVAGGHQSSPPSEHLC